MTQNSSKFDPEATDTTRKRYQRMSPVYDLMEALAEPRYKKWRGRLWSYVTGPKVLEVGVGTGKNLPYYPEGVKVSAIDLTPGMLKRAQQKAEDQKINVEMFLGDVQKLDFPDNYFDSVVATFVLCSVPDVRLGLKEIKRVVKDGGQVLLLDHVRSGLPILGFFMDLLNPITVSITGVNINRPTVRTVKDSGLTIERIEELGVGDIYKMIIARKPGIGEE
jgi:phosphatidylethanolamine/phosphatidyl-N-methylethanolamine N-methyltransferase